MFHIFSLCPIWRWGIFRYWSPLRFLLPILASITVVSTFGCGNASESSLIYEAPSLPNDPVRKWHQACLEDTQCRLDISSDQLLALFNSTNRWLPEERVLLTDGERFFTVISTDRQVLVEWLEKKDGIAFVRMTASIQETFYGHVQFDCRGHVTETCQHYNSAALEVRPCRWHHVHLVWLCYKPDQHKKPSGLFS